MGASMGWLVETEGSAVQVAQVVGLEGSVAVVVQVELADLVEVRTAEVPLGVVGKEEALQRHTSHHLLWHPNRSSSLSATCNRTSLIDSCHRH